MPAYQGAPSGKEKSLEFREHISLCPFALHAQWPLNLSFRLF